MMTSLELVRRRRAAVFALAKAGRDPRERYTDRALAELFDERELAELDELVAAAAR